MHVTELFTAFGNIWLLQEPPKISHVTSTFNDCAKKKQINNDHTEVIRQYEQYNNTLPH